MQLAAKVYGGPVDAAYTGQLGAKSRQREISWAKVIFGICGEMPGLSPGFAELTEILCFSLVFLHVFVKKFHHEQFQASTVVEETITVNTHIPIVQIQQ